jgi:ribosomal protein L3
LPSNGSIRRNIYTEEFASVLLSLDVEGNQTKNSKVYETCRSMGDMGYAYRTSENLKGRRIRLRYLDIVGRIILKWSVEKCVIALD